ncbi:carboxypeptidase Taq [Limimonas halophila]|uniref:Metal-dependent carboxypeptidase n=1 Tax=Limimonas halophila TaxID=1082479 RepID=A0A1G7V5C4_9PROT|nr:carboxypeptidase M32 [Limimonas halophila]SDG54150.1 carboxypeptidase Taq [Limimonas halophila]
MSDAYRELERRFARMAALGEAGGMLNWDAQVMMPSGGAEARSEQLAALDVTAHEMLTDPRVGELLDTAEQHANALDGWQQANLAEMRRQWRHATAVPSALVEALTRATKQCEMVWREAKPDSDFARVKPYLGEVLRLVREEAAAKGEALGLSPYDALLDQFEPGMRAERVTQIFDDLAGFLPHFLDDVLRHQAAGPAPEPPQGPFPQAKQEALAARLMRTMGLETAHSRLDTSSHPFTGGAPDDIRITTRWDERDFTTGAMAVIHETGHALYERGLPGDWRRQPVGEARGMALHESQALLAEMQVSRGEHFLRHAAPVMREALGGSGPAWEADNLHRLATRVAPGYIRVDADEVTYPAHVILRYRLETALISGDMPLDELPGAWNAGMQDLLGITPPEDRLGCLQDIHWFDGGWGYFPTYTLGAIAAAQLYRAACTAEPGIPSYLERGDVSPLLTWLREHVHGLGSSLSTDEILRRATGRGLDVEAFKGHLRERYLAP